MRHKRHSQTKLNYDFHMNDFIGDSTEMQKVFSLIENASNSTANTFIYVESGTGKELVAKAIHFGRSLAEKQFVGLNCAAFPESLFESELFGYSKGAFTGAIKDKMGLIESANGGTLFLDEISEMKPYLQAKLLRVIEERAVRPIGEVTSKEIKIHFIAATNRKIKNLFIEKRLRKDLFYRLNVLPIHIPPLRNRKDDIPSLIEHFIKKFNLLFGKNIIKFSDRAMNSLISYYWPGNVRELENLVQKTVILENESIISHTNLPSYIKNNTLSEKATPETFITLKENEKQHINKVLKFVNGNKVEAAQILGINRSSLYSKMRRHKI